MEQRLWEIFDKLQSLSFPVIAALQQHRNIVNEGFTRAQKESIVQTLIAPGQSRFDLIQWLLLSIDIKTQVFFQQSASNPATIKSESVVQRLISGCMVFGLCGPSDFDLVKGTSSSLSVNLELIEALLELALLEAHNHGDMESAMGRSRSFLNSLLQEDFRSLLVSSPKSLPGDLAAEASKFVQNGEVSKQELLEAQKNLLQRQQGQASKLKSLQERGLHTSSSSNDASRSAEQLGREISLTSKTLSQILDDFMRVYESDFRARIKPEINTSHGSKDLPSETGKLTESVFKQLLRFTETMSTIDECMLAHKYLQSDLAGQIRDLVSYTASSLPKERLSELQRLSSVLESAALRRQRGKLDL